MKVKFTEDDMEALDSAYYTITKHFICDNDYDPSAEGWHDCKAMRDLWNKMCDKFNKRIHNTDDQKFI